MKYYQKGLVVSMPYAVSTWNDLTGYVFDRRSIADRATAMKEFTYQVRVSKQHGSQHDETVIMVNKDTDKIVKQHKIKGWKKRKTNPMGNTGAIKTGVWTPVKAIKRNADGSIDVLKEKTTSRQANISQGFMAGGVFHPIRSAGDYDPSRVGEGGKKKKKAPARKKAVTKKRATTKRVTKKKAATKKKSAWGVMPTSRRDYGGDGSRYRNPAKHPHLVQIVQGGIWKTIEKHSNKTEANKMVKALKLAGKKARLK